METKPADTTCSCQRNGTSLIFMLSVVLETLDSCTSEIQFPVTRPAKAEKQLYLAFGILYTQASGFPYILFHSQNQISNYKQQTKVYVACVNYYYATVHNMAVIQLPLQVP